MYAIRSYYVSTESFLNKGRIENSPGDDVAAATGKCHMIGRSCFEARISHGKGFQNPVDSPVKPDFPGIRVAGVNDPVRIIDPFEPVQRPYFGFDGLPFIKRPGGNDFVKVSYNFV